MCTFVCISDIACSPTLSFSHYYYSLFFPFLFLFLKQIPDTAINSVGVVAVTVSHFAHIFTHTVAKDVIDQPPHPD